MSEGAPPPPDSASSAAELARGRASAAIALGRFEEAVRQAGRAVAAEPAAIEGYGLLAQALIGQNEMRRAQEAAEQGLSHGPDSEWLLRLRATEAAKKRQDPQLAALYERLDSDKKRGQL